METQGIITSTQNARVRRHLLLREKASLRREAGLFVVEGQREIGHCVAAGYTVRTLFTCPDIVPESAAAAIACRERVSVSARVYERMAVRGGTEGIVAEVEERTLGLDDIALPEAPLIIVLESVEKPGNLGAVLRTADAAGATAVVVCDPRADLHSPNTIRASVGAVFTVPCVATTTAECIAFLRSHGIQILTAQLQDSLPYYATPMTGPTAIVMGTEDRGLTADWREAAERHIRIPMLGRLDSLNVSVSAAILTFEAVRQREAAAGPAGGLARGID